MSVGQVYSRETDFILREFAPADLASYAKLRSDGKFAGSWYKTEELSISFSNWLLSSFLNHQRQVPRREYQLAVADPAGNFVIGSVGIRKYSDFQASVGFELEVSYRGRGIISRALNQTIHLFSEPLQVTMLTAEVNIHNLPSMKVLENAGFEFDLKSGDMLIFRKGQVRKD